MSSISKFFVRVNKDPEFRAKFLDDPAKVIEQYGIEVSGETKAELERLTPIVRKHLPALADIPKGYDQLLDEVAHGKRRGRTKDPETLII